MNPTHLSMGLLPTTRLTYRGGTLAPSTSKLLSPILLYLFWFYWIDFQQFPTQLLYHIVAMITKCHFSVAQGSGFWSVRATGNNVARSFLSNILSDAISIVMSFSSKFYSSLFFFFFSPLSQRFLFVLLCYLKIFGGFVPIFEKNKRLAFSVLIFAAFHISLACFMFSFAFLLCL